MHQYKFLFAVIKFEKNMLPLHSHLMDSEMIIDKLFTAVVEAINVLYKSDFDTKQLQIQPTRQGIKGDFTLVVFPILKVSHLKPVDTAQQIGEYVIADVLEVESFNVVNGFLNFCIKSSYWVKFINDNFYNKEYGCAEKKSAERVVIEFSSPNTNKPLHLGHVRNNLIGVAVANLLRCAGKDVVKVNLVNDRGIHICKSMLAWQKWGNGITPEAANIKGDHLVGDYYVEFDKHYKSEIKQLVDGGMSEDEAKDKARLINEAREMLKQWEDGNKAVIDLWRTMNEWVYKGFDVTYKRLGVVFDKVYYESQTYLLGKEIVADALAKGFVQKDPDGSVWIDFTDEGLDRKLLLRKDGTSVYITQDIGTAILRHDEFMPDKMIYVVGNEQIYHFDVLKLTLKRFGYDWADSIYHLSYGMVELTTGKMKSREGTVVDADDLMDEMLGVAAGIIKEQGKVEAGTDEADKLADMVGLAALKYFILKVDPKKQMVFNPADSIDFNGNTGPFIQYTHARICSLLLKAGFDKYNVNLVDDSFTAFNDYEVALIKQLHDYPTVLQKAADDFSPAQIANYIYELAKFYNRFYQEVNVTKEENDELKQMRLLLSCFVASVIKNGMAILGIEVPEKM